VSRKKFPRKPYNKSFIDQACSVKIAGYWPCSFFASLWTSTPSRFINTQKKNLANIQPSWPHTWSITRTWGHVRIEIPYPALFPLRIPHPNPTKTRNPTPARNCNSLFPSLFSAQIPNMTAKKSQIPHPAKPIGDPHLRLHRLNVCQAISRKAVLFDVTLFNLTEYYAISSEADSFDLTLNCFPSTLCHSM